MSPRRPPAEGAGAHATQYPPKGAGAHVPRVRMSPNTLLRAKLCCMCRNIRTLYNFDPPATEEEVRGAALQYVRKVSGFTKPSRANEAAFERAVEEVAEVSSRLLNQLVTSAPPKDREEEAAKRRARSAQRYAA